MHYFTGVVVEHSADENSALLIDRAWAALEPYWTDNLSEYYRLICACIDLGWPRLPEGEWTDALAREAVTDCDFCHGRGWLISGHNPRGIWAYGYIGGRFSGCLFDPPPPFEAPGPDLGVLFRWHSNRPLQENAVAPRRVPRTAGLDAVVTPDDGWVWVGRGHPDLLFRPLPPPSDDAWDQLKSVLGPYGDGYTLVGLDLADRPTIDPCVVEVNDESLALVAACAAERSGR